MKRWVKIFENIFVSVTFAEMGEPHTSREDSDLHPVNSPDGWGDGCVRVPLADGGLVRMFIMGYEHPGVMGLIPLDGSLITSWE